MDNDNQFSSNNQFELWRKWFWIGIVMALFIVPGIIYGIALAMEKDRRKEGIIIILISIAWYIFFSFFFAWLSASGIMPHYRVLQLR